MLGWGQQHTVATAAEAANAQRTIEWLRARLWVREATGRNDGPAVAAIIRAGGGNPATLPEYCGFTQAADQLANKLPIPANGMQGRAAAWFLLSSPRTYYVQATRGQLGAIRIGHQAGLYSVSQGRICHITRVVAIVPGLRPGLAPRGFYCIAGNEGSGTNAGLHLTFYPAASIYAASNWLL